MGGNSSTHEQCQSRFQVAGSDEFTEWVTYRPERGIVSVGSWTISIFQTIENAEWTESEDETLSKLLFRSSERLSF
jgi:hypothetical protein